jgi:glycosyltransferase involved in cell wall biosynthesis
MHIAFLIPTLDRIGGAEHQLLLLAKGLADRGWQVSVIALSGSGADVSKELQTKEITFFSLHMRKGLVDPRGWRQLSRWLRGHQPDVLHAHLPHAVLMARWCRLLSPVRVLIETIHSPATGGSLRGLAYRITTQQPDVVTAVSRTSAETWSNKAMLDQSKLAVIPNGIDLDHWKSDPEIRRTVRRGLRLQDEFVWLAVGRLEPVKDHATLLHAFAKISSNSLLLIAGTGRLDDPLRHLACRLDIQDRVRFLGFERDVLSWMQCVDGFVLSSRSEGLPLAFLEAAACELPVIYTDIAAMRELLFHRFGSSGVPVGDSNALAIAMNGMMGLDPQERSEIGRELRLFVTSRFNLSSVLVEWEKTYSASLTMKPYPTRSGNRATLLRDKTLQLQ